MAKKAASRQRDKREGATWVNLGKDGHLKMRLSREKLEGAIQQSNEKSLRQEAQDLYQQIYPENLPRPTLGVFLSHAIDLGLQQIRQQITSRPVN